MYKYCLLFVFLMFLLVTCTSVERAEYSDEYVWIKDKNLKFQDKSDLSKCLNIPVSKLNEYSFLVIEEFYEEEINYIDIQSKLQLKLEKKIVQLIKSKMEMTFKETIYDDWQFQRITLPVKYRMFIKETKRGTYYKYIAVYYSDDMSITKLLKYLPYEYKEPFLEKLRERINIIEKY
jgi:hypothetical protein